MILTFEYTNDIENKSFKIDSRNKKPIEFLFKDASEKNTHIYMNALEATFKGLSNCLYGNISGINIDCGTFGSIKKNRCNVKWNLSYSKLKTSIYILSKKELREENFYAKGVLLDNGNVNIIKNKSLNNNKLFKENLANAIAALLKSEFDYIYSFQDGHLQIINSITNTPIKSIDDIENDDVYMLFKLLDILIVRGKHLGIFLINCDGISENVLNCLHLLYKQFQKDLNVNFLFFFNLNKNYKIETQKISISNVF
ncbi:hypothetical protein [Clostridioides difficile]|uniref:hypothetical protein n=1 Tax=Clostridioides difficile TaxID=1496 RepID=UPI0010342ECB|nr:hypothetical protein [Clostridioides difficile]MDM9943991.1 hypothetical protein [Clostridioides difficile]